MAFCVRVVVLLCFSCVWCLHDLLNALFYRLRAIGLVTNKRSELAVIESPRRPDPVLAINLTGVPLHTLLKSYKPF